jgi:hypothetical protein
MATPINKAKFFDNMNFKSAAEKTSSSCLFVGVQGAIVYCKSTQNGVLGIDMRVLDDEWWCLAEEPVKAGIPHVVDVGYYVPELRVRFFPDAPCVFSCVAYGYPSVFIREDLSTRGERDQV